ncbi:MAG: hypothetical protein N3E41_01545 [Thermofilaceae archaeon]|nr:hypothetical protein [Thermofilaceae archaeon]
MELSLDRVLEVIARSEPEPLTLPIHSLDHADHVLNTALMGHAKLAADHLMHPELAEDLPAVVSALVRRIHIFLGHRQLRNCSTRELEGRLVARGRIYEMLLEIALNLIGVERRWACVDPSCAERVYDAVKSTLEACEESESRELGQSIVLRAVIERELRKAGKVNRGKSMVAYMAKEIYRTLDADSLADSFFNSAMRVFTDNFYRRAYEEGLCKFGNDYALGLRWLRHLGFVQVSTNPVLAARAYEDDPELWSSFQAYVEKVLVKEHKEWLTNPEAYADALAMEATRFALLENFYVFRVPFVLSGYRDGLVSYQLNPLIAHDAEESVEAVKVFVERLERDLAVYDEYLWWGYRVPEKGRPNLVIKVAAAYPASLEVTRRINEMGVGQNITLSYTVSQEVLLGFEAMKGMARALKKGIIPTQTYDTNMGGRLEDHLREYTASKLLLDGLGRFNDSEKWAFLERLAKQLGVRPEEWDRLKNSTLREVVEYICSVKVLGRDLRRSPFEEALAHTGAYGSLEEVKQKLNELEEALRLSGTFIAKRVYEIFFSPWNREKWINFLAREEGLTKEQAELVFSRLDLLPASKRKPEDTLLTFSSLNVTNTEFPDHQLSVAQTAQSLTDFYSLRESIAQSFEERYLSLLMQIDDFVKAYEASAEVCELLRKVGISREHGSRGINRQEWSSYGPCVKTLNEFTVAYTAFRDKVVKLAKSIRHYA